MSDPERKNTKQNSAQQSLTMAVVAPAVSGCVLGCLTITVFGVLALRLGFCFIWPQAIPSWTINIFFCVLLTAIAFKIKKSNPPWILFLAEVLLIAVFGVAFSTWEAPKSIFRISFLDPIPQSVVIHRSYYFQAGPDAMAWIHFSAPPDVMLSIIQTNNLTGPLQIHEWSTTKGFNSITPEWWKTNELTHPSLYRCEHTGISRPWVIGMWLNAETNEAFGYVY